MVVMVPVLIALSLLVVAGPLAVCLSADPLPETAAPLFSAAALQAQTVQQSEPPQPASDADTFFSGNVVESAPDHIVVSRTILGKPPEKRRFVMNGQTKVEGRLRNKVRVTVRYEPTPDGDVALSVLVRESAPDKQDGGKKK